MATRHTPGELLFKDGQIYRESDGRTVAVIPYWDKEDEQVALGNLLAAAPRMLEVITMLIDRLDYHGSIDHIREEGPIQDAREVIRVIREG